MIKQAIIPVAGFGTRLLPISRAIPKELLPIGPKPTLQWIAEELAEAGLTELCLVTSPDKAQIGQLFLNDPKLDVALERQGKAEWLKTLWSHGPYANTIITSAIQNEPLGLGHAVLCGEPKMHAGPFVVALGDCLMSPVGHSQLLSRMLQTYSDQNADAVIALQRVAPEQVSRYGVADTDRNNPEGSNGKVRLLGLVEKPSRDEAPSNLAVSARYVFSPTIFDYLRRAEPGRGGEIQLTDAIHRWIADGARVYGVILEDHEGRLDVGNYDSFARGFLEYALHDSTLRDFIRERLKETE